MSKDRARPFSKKHRRYWIPVTGGMVLIGIFNVILGYCTYSAPKDPERIQLHLPPPGTPADVTEHTLPDGTIEQAISNGEIPGAVMRAYSTQFPRTIPASATKRTKAGAVSYRLDTTIYRADGTLELQR